MPKLKLTAFRKLIVILLILLSNFVNAQTAINTSFSDRMNYIFQQIEKSRIPNGLLLDYAMEFADLKSYNGVLTDSNMMNAGLLKDIYSTITMSAIHNNAGGFYSPGYMDSIWKSQRQPIL